MTGKIKPLSAAILLVSILCSVPVVSAVLLEPRGTSWTGINSRNTADLNSYLSMVEEIRQDGWKARNLFTAEMHPPFQIRPVHILMGLSGKLMPGVTSVWIMGASQILFSFVLILILALFSIILFQENEDRLPTFLILCLGSGLGWTHLVPDPPDLRIVETSTFLTLLSPPIFTISLSLILGIILAQWYSWDAANRKTAVWLSLLSGLFALWLGLERPFSLANLLTGIGGALFIKAVQQRRIPFRALFLAVPLFLGSAIALKYHLGVLQEIPAFKEWGRQNVLQTPEWPRLFMSLGFLVPLALYGFRPLISRFPTLGSILACYILGSLVFTRMPIPFQERLWEGTPALLSIPASIGAIRLKNHFHFAMVRKLILAAVILILIPSGILGWLSDMQAFQKGGPPQYLPNSFLDGMRQLHRLARPDEAIFSSYVSGNFIPAYSARSVVIGHSIQTARFRQKWGLVERFFRLQPDDPGVREILKQTGASWVFWGPEEALLARGGGFDPDRSPFLKCEFNKGPTKIYRVLK